MRNYRYGPNPRRWLASHSLERLSFLETEWCVFVNREKKGEKGQKRGGNGEKEKRKTKIERVWGFLLWFCKKKLVEEERAEESVVERNNDLRIFRNKRSAVRTTRWVEDVGWPLVSLWWQLCSRWVQISFYKTTLIWSKLFCFNHAFLFGIFLLFSKFKFKIYTNFEYKLIQFPKFKSKINIYPILKTKKKSWILS